MAAVAFQGRALLRVLPSQAVRLRCLLVRLRHPAPSVRGDVCPQVGAVGRCNTNETLQRYVLASEYCARWIGPKLDVRVDTLARVGDSNDTGASS